MRMPTVPMPRPKRRALFAAGGVAVLVAACAEPPPRSFHDFMEDRIAREGVLARCDREREARDDIECANARRAAATVALRQERERREQLARESDRKIRALREQIERREQLARDAEAAARRAYDEQWESGAAGTVTTPDPAEPSDSLAHDAAPDSGASASEADPAATGARAPSPGAEAGPNTAAPVSAPVPGDGLEPIDVPSSRRIAIGE